MADNMSSQQRPTLCRSEPPLLLPAADGPTPPEPQSALEFRRIGHFAQRPLIRPDPQMVAAGAFAPPRPAAPPAGPAFPDIPDDLNGFIPESGIDSPVTDIVHPYIGEFPVPSAKMPEEKEFSPLDGPTNVILEEKLASQLPELTEEQNLVISMAQEFFITEAAVDNPYKIKVQEQLTTATDPLATDPNSGKMGYLDEYGYLVEWNRTKDSEGKDIMVAHALGEATYFTAIAAVALASGNYRQDSWEAQNANTHISKFIDVLEHKSWGNMDEDGESHPIRHPAWLEYYGDGQMRNRPLSKDSFGQIVLACYYAYTCPNSSSQVRQQAQSLLNKWIKYLSRHQWRLHSNYIPKEFEASNKKFDNLFEDEEHKNRIKSFGPETFLLYPHELWALRNCAIEMAVPHEIVVPPADFSTAVNATFFEPFLEDLIKNSGDAVDYLYDRLQYRKKWSLDLVPGWKKSRITGTLSIGAFGPLSKKQARDMFEAVVRDSLLSAFKFHQKVDGIFDSIMRPLSQFLYSPEINQIVRDLIDQVCPWLDPTVLVEWMDFVLALEVTKQTYDESNSAYAIWPFIMEIESRPYLRLLLEPQFREVFGFLAKKGNPNGTWAWLARRHDVVMEQIAVFEEANDVLRWRGYAYGENAYNDWIKKTGEQDPDHFSSRIDYLVLKNLAEKGLPEMPVLEASFQPFLDFAISVLNWLLQRIKADFESLKYVRKWLDELGNIVEETFSPDRITQVFRHASGQMVRVVCHPDGVVDITWSTATGAFKSFERLARVAENGLAHVDDLLEFQERFIDGTLKYWKWKPGKVLQTFGKYVGVPESGLVGAAVNVIQLARGPAGELGQVIRSASGVIQSITKWSAAGANGFAHFTERVEQKIRNEVGELLAWTYHPGGALKEFSHWAKSADDLSAEGVDQVKRAVREIGGAFHSVEFTHGVFDRAITYAASLPSGITKAIDCTVLQIRYVTGVLEQWELDKGVVKTYSQWQHATEDGAAKAVDAVVRVERQGEKIVKHVFKEGVAVQSQILDAVGNVIGSVGGAISDAWDSIKHWHF